MNTMIITSESDFSNSLLDYVTDTDRDEGEMFALTFADVAEFGRKLGVSVGEYVAEDLDEMAERLADFRGLFEYLEGDEYEAVFVVRKAYHKVSRGVLAVD